LGETSCQMWRFRFVSSCYPLPARRDVPFPTARLATVDLVRVLSVQPSPCLGHIHALKPMCHFPMQSVIIIPSTPTQPSLPLLAAFPRPRSCCTVSLTPIPSSMPPPLFRIPDKCIRRVRSQCSPKPPHHRIRDLAAVHSCIVVALVVAVFALEDGAFLLLVCRGGERGRLRTWWIGCGHCEKR